MSTTFDGAPSLADNVADDSLNYIRCSPSDVCVFHEVIRCPMKHDD